MSGSDANDQQPLKRKLKRGPALSRVLPVVPHPALGLFRLPTKVQQVVDLLLEDWDGATPVQGGKLLTKLCEWISDHYSALQLGEWDERTPCVINPADFCGDVLSDEGEGGLLAALPDDEPTLTDAMRIAHIRAVLTDHNELWQSCYYACSTVPIRSGHHRAVLAFGVRGGGYAGLRLSWFGVFPTEQTAWNHLRAAGWVFDDSEVAALMDAQLLSLWDPEYGTGGGVSFGRDAGTFIETYVPPSGGKTLLDDAEYNSEDLLSVFMMQRGFTRRVVATPEELWERLSRRLSSVVLRMRVHEFLVLWVTGTSRLVQLAKFDRVSVRVECGANRFLPTTEQLPPQQEAVLHQLGWAPPDCEPESQAVHSDPKKGSSHWYRDFSTPGDSTSICSLLIKTLRLALEVSSPEALSYTSGTFHGPSVAFPELGIALRSTSSIPEQLEEGVLDAVRRQADFEIEDMGNATYLLSVNDVPMFLDYVDDCHLRIDAAVVPVRGRVAGVLKSINALNTEHISYGRLYVSEKLIRYSASILRVPDYVVNVPVALQLASENVKLAVQLLGELDSGV